MNKNNKTTEKDFNIFKEECDYWIKYFGLYDYRYNFSHSNIDSLAKTQMNSNRTDRCCLLVLGTNWKINEVTDNELRKSAFHEVLEVMFWKIGDLLFDHCGNKIERDNLHELIRTFENSLFTESYNTRFGGKNGSKKNR